MGDDSPEESAIRSCIRPNAIGQQISFRALPVELSAPSRRNNPRRVIWESRQYRNVVPQTFEPGRKLVDPCLGSTYFGRKVRRDKQNFHLCQAASFAR